MYVLLNEPLYFHLSVFRVKLINYFIIVKYMTNVCLDFKAVVIPRGSGQMLRGQAICWGPEEGTINLPYVQYL